MFALLTCDVDAQLCSGNLGTPVFWEDFGSGAALYGPALPVGVTSYAYLAGTPLNGSYVISNTGNPSGTYGYVADGDHTGNPNGYMMVVDSDYGPSEVFRKSVLGLCPNTTYVFSTYLANNNTPAAAVVNCGAGYIYANLKLQVEYPTSVIQGSVATGNLPLASGNSTLNWVQYGFVFTTGPTQTSCAVVLINNAPGGCGNDYVVDDITFSPCGPGISLSASPSTLVCQGQTAVLQSSFTVGTYSVPQFQWEYSANGTTWTNISGATSANYTLSAVSNTNGGMYRLLSAENGNINSANCRIIAGPISLSVTPTNLSVTSATSCAQQTTTLSASGGSNYTWSTGATSSTIAISSSVTAFYTVTAVVGSCTASAISQLSIVASPSLSVSGIFTLCVNGSTTLTANGASSYTWQPGPVVASSLVATPAANAVYSITGQNSSGCTSTISAAINVFPTPVVNFTTYTVTCANLGSATVTASGGGGPYSYSWAPVVQSGSVATGLYPGSYTISVLDAGTGCTSTATTIFLPVVPLTGTVVSGQLCNGINTATASILLSGGSGSTTYLWQDANSGSQTNTLATGLSAGIHSVTATDAITFCGVTQTFQVTQPPPLSANIVASQTVACTGSSATLVATASGGTGSYSYTWAPSFPGNSLQVTQATAGTSVFSVTVSDGNNCTTSASSSLLYVDYPVVSASNASVCFGQTTQLSASGASSYSWLPVSSTSNTVSVSPPASTVFTVIGSNYGCNDTVLLSVTVFTPPLASIAGATSVCEGQTISLLGSGGGTYSWSAPGGVSSSSQGFSLSPASLSQSGNYSLVVTSPQGCTTPTAAQLTVLPKPLATVSGATVCLGMAAVVGVSGGVAWVWSGPGGFSANTASVSVPIITPSSVGIYSVTVTGSNSCVAEKTVNLVGQPYDLPTPTIIADPSICLYSLVSLQGLGGISYSWQGPNGFASSQQNPVFAVGSTAVAGIYTLTVKNASNCVASTTVALSVFPPPSATLQSSSGSKCVPFCTNLSLKTSSLSSTLQSVYYTIYDQPLSDTAFVYCIWQAGDYPFKVSFVDVNGCAGASSLLVTGWPLPKAEFSFDPPQPVESKDLVHFTNASVGQNLTYNWYFTSNNGFFSQDKEVDYLFENSGTFPVALVVRNNRGCLDTAIHFIRVMDDFAFYMPNSFTPNGDGMNDEFGPKGIGILKYRLDIFDRWGERLFSSEDILSPWDGRFKGQLCKTDVYVWKVTITTAANHIKTYEGHVSLIDK